MTGFDVTGVQQDFVKTWQEDTMKAMPEQLARAGSAQAARGWRWLVVGLALMGLAGSAYGDESDSAVEFAQSRICIVSEGKARPLDVELAETPEQRARGLMMRDSLPAASGMLFIYPTLQSGRSGFWMYQTRIPLDVAFLAPDGSILRISAMEPCTESAAPDCPVYRAEQPFQAALEMNQGFFADEGIQVGDRIIWTGASGCEAKETQAAARIHNAGP